MLTGIDVAAHQWISMFASVSLNYYAPLKAPPERTMQPQDGNEGSISIHKPLLGNILKPWNG